MLEHPSISNYEQFSVISSQFPAERGRAKRQLQLKTELSVTTFECGKSAGNPKGDPQRLNARLALEKSIEMRDETVRPPWRHGEHGRNDRAT